MIRSQLISKVIFPIADLINGTSIISKYNLLKKTQWCSKEEIEKLQILKLRKLIMHAYENVPYYRRTLKHLSLNPGDFKSISELQKIPVLTKEDIRNAGDSLYAVNSKQLGRISARTGGSTGEPLGFFRDKNTRSWAWGAMYRFFEWAGVQVGEKLITVGGGSLMGFLGKRTLYSELAQLVEKLQGNNFFPAFALNLDLIQKMSDVINRKKVRIIRGYPSTLYLIAKYAEANHVDFSNISICLTTAEKLFSFQRKAIENTFQANVFDQYGCGEVQGIAGQCEEKGFYHAFDEHVIVELGGDQDSKRKRIPAILTNLDNYAMPFIRYENGDVLRLTGSECDCGRKLSIIKKVEGRTHDFLVAQDDRVIPGEFIPHLFQEARGFDRYFVHQKTIDDLTIKVVPNEEYSISETDAIANVLKEHLGKGVSVTFEIVDEGLLPSSQSGKLFFVKSEVKPFFG